MKQRQDIPPTPEAVARSLQISVGAFILGVVAYGGFVLKQGGLAGPPQPPSTATVGAGAAALSFLLHWFLPQLVMKQPIRASGGDGEILVGAYMSQTIIAMALLEGAAFLNLFALSKEHHWWSLAAAILLIMAMAAQIPTAVRIAHWVEARQLELR